MSRIGPENGSLAAQFRRAPFRVATNFFQLSARPRQVTTKTTSRGPTTCGGRNQIWRILDFLLPVKSLRDRRANSARGRFATPASRIDSWLFVTLVEPETNPASANARATPALTADTRPSTSRNRTRGRPPNTQECGISAGLLARRAHTCRSNPRLNEIERCLLPVIRVDPGHRLQASFRFTSNEHCTLAVSG
jgi:hypothetical protein